MDIGSLIANCFIKLRKDMIFLTTIPKRKKINIFRRKKHIIMGNFIKGGITATTIEIMKTDKKNSIFTIHPDGEMTITLNGYAIIPKEEYEELKKLQEK